MIKRFVRFKSSPHRDDSSFLGLVTDLFFPKKVEKEYIYADFGGPTPVGYTKQGDPIYRDIPSFPSNACCSSEDDCSEGSSADESLSNNSSPVDTDTESIFTDPDHFWVDGNLYNS